MNIDLVPKKGSLDAKKNCRHQYWIVFARRITHNDFIKNYLLTKYNSICPWCNKKMNSFVIHHTDYEHECIRKSCNKVLVGNRKHFIPDCEKCFSDNTSAFDECIKRIAPVHKLCNKEIEEHRLKLLDTGKNNE